MAKRTDRDLLRLALHHAIDERVSYIGSWGGNDSEASVVRARELVAEWKALLARRYSDTMAADRLADDLKSGRATLVNVTALTAGPFKVPR